LLGAFLFRQQIGRLVLKQTVRSLSRAIGGEVSYERIEGDIFSRPVVTGLRLNTESETVGIKRLVVKYDLVALLRKKLLLTDVKVEDPEIRISPRAREERRWEEKMGLTFPQLSAAQVKVSNGRLFWDGVLRGDSIGLELSFKAGGSRLELKLDSGACYLPQEKVRVRSITAGLNVRNDSLLIRGLQLYTGSSYLGCKLNVGLLDYGIMIDSVQLSVDLRELLALPGRVELLGMGKLDKDDRVLKATGRGEGLRWRHLRLPLITGSFNLVDSIFELALQGSDSDMGSVSITGQISLNDFRFAGQANLDGVPVNKLQTSLPDFALSASLTFTGRLGTVAGLLKVQQKGIGDSVNMSLRGSIGELGIDTLYATLNYYGKSWELRELVVSGPIGNFQFDGIARRDFLLARCKMMSFDLKVAGSLLAGPFTGRADGSLQLAFGGDSWQFLGTVRVAGFGWGGFEVTNGLVDANLSGRRLWLSPPAKGSLPRSLRGEISGRVAVGGEGVKIAGREWNWAQFVWTGPEFELRLEQDSIQLLALGDLNFEKSGSEALVRTLIMNVADETLALLDSCRLQLNGDRLVIEDVWLKLTDGEVKFNACFARAVAPVVNLTAERLNLQKISRIVGWETDLSGTVNLNLYGQDTLTAILTGSEVGVNSGMGMYFKNIDARLKLTTNTALLESVKFIYRIDTSYVAGSIEYDLKPRWQLRRMNLDLNLADPGVWVLQVTKPYVEIQEGVIYSRARINWQPGDLRLAGRARVSSGYLVVPSVQSTVERFDAELTFSDNRIILEKLSGRTTRGILTAEGLVQLAAGGQCEGLNFKTHFAGAEAVPITSVLAVGSGDINIDWRPSEPVLISGKAKIEEALATIGFGGQAVVASSEGPTVNYDIHIYGDRGIWLRNRDADIELGVDLTVRAVQEELLYTGEMVCRQGVVYYLDHTLRITEGKMIFDNVSQFDPRLDLSAETRVRSQNSNAPEKIVLKLTGTLKEPSFLFVSEPPVWDETKIISYLSLNVTMDELSALEQKELVSRLLSERLLAYFQTQVAKRVRDFVELDYLELESGLSGREQARVTVGKYVGPNLYVSYTQNFMEQFQPAFRIEYYLNRRNELLAERTTDGRYSFRYRFKFRF